MFVKLQNICLCTDEICKATTGSGNFRRYAITITFKNGKSFDIEYEYWEECEDVFNQLLDTLGAKEIKSTFQPPVSELEAFRDIM